MFKKPINITSWWITFAALPIFLFLMLGDWLLFPAVQSIYPTAKYQMWQHVWSFLIMAVILTVTALQLNRFSSWLRVAGVAVFLLLFKIQPSNFLKDVVTQVKESATSSSR